MGLRQSWEKKLDHHLESLGEALWKVDLTLLKNSLRVAETGEQHGMKDKEKCSGMSTAGALLGAAESRKDLLMLREPPESQRLLSGQ